MGASSSHPLCQALQQLLRLRGLKLRQKTLMGFLEDIDLAAPWFAVSGNLNTSCWDKLGKDLERGLRLDVIGQGTYSLWRIIRACLDDQKYTRAVKESQTALEEIKEKRSTQGNESGEHGGSGAGNDSEPNSEEEVESIRRQCSSLNLEETKANPPPYNSNAPLEMSGNTFNAEAWREFTKGGGTLALPVFQDHAGNRYHEPLDFKIVKDLAEAVRTYGVSASFTIAIVESLERYAMTPADWQRVIKATLNPGQYLDWRATLIEKANQQAAQNQTAGNPQNQWDADMLLGQGRFLNNQLGYPQQVYEQINRISIQAFKSLPNRGEVSGNLTKIIQGSTEPFSDFVARMMQAAGRIFGDAETAMPLIKQLVYEQCTKECRSAITPYKNKPLEIWMKVCREIGAPLTATNLAAALMAATQARNNPSTIPGVCFGCGQQGHLKRNRPQRLQKGGTSNNQRQIYRGPPPLCSRCRKGKHPPDQCRSIRDIDGNLLQGPVSNPRQNPQPKNVQRGPRPQGPQTYGAQPPQAYPVQVQSPQTYPQNQTLDNTTNPWPSFQHPLQSGEPLRVPQDWTSVPPPDWY